jgi:hypothetical protein
MPQYCDIPATYHSTNHGPIAANPYCALHRLAINIRALLNFVAFGGKITSKHRVGVGLNGIKKYTEADINRFSW